MQEAEIFGVPSKAVARRVTHRAPVPMFDPMLQAARETVKSLEYFRQEITHAETMCSNMEQVVTELLESRIAVEDCKAVQATVQHLRETLTRVSTYCGRLENLAADLHGNPEEEFAMPHVMVTGRGASSE